MAPIHWAAEAGDLVKVVSLIEQDHTRLELVWDSTTPLMVAAKAGHMHVAYYLLDKGALIDRCIPRSPSGGGTALWYASFHGHAGVASLLMERGADPTITTADRDTPLMAACWRGHSAVVRLLVTHAAYRDIDAQDEAGCTALWLASRFNRDLMVQLLLEAGADASLAGKEDSSPGWLAALQPLLTPLGIAMRQKHVFCVDLLQMSEVIYHVTKAHRVHDTAVKIQAFLAANNASSPEQAMVKHLDAAAGNIMQGRLAAVEIRAAQTKGEVERMVLKHLMLDLKRELAVEMRAYTPQGYTDELWAALCGRVGPR